MFGGVKEHSWIDFIYYCSFSLFSLFIFSVIYSSYHGDDDITFIWVSSEYCSCSFTLYDTFGTFDSRYIR